MTAQICNRDGYGTIGTVHRIGHQMYLEKADWLCFWLVIRDSRPSIVVLSTSLLDVVCLVVDGQDCSVGVYPDGAE